MTWIDCGRVGQCHEYFHERMLHVLKVAGREIDAADRALKQRVADQRDRRFLAPQRDAAGRMTWRVEDLEVVTSEFKQLPLIDVGIDGRRLNSWRDEGRKVEVRILIKPRFRAVAEHIDGTKAQFHLRKARDVIAMAMRENAE